MLHSKVQCVTLRELLPPSRVMVFEVSALRRLPLTGDTPETVLPGCALERDDHPLPSSFSSVLIVAP